MIDIPALRASVDLVALISLRVKLTRRGREYVGLCPFHNEKTPSFAIVPAKHRWFCNGCHEHGDALDWVMRTEGVTLQQAAERLGGAPADHETAKRLRREQAVRDAEIAREAERRGKLASYRDQWPDCSLPEWAIEL
jgi:DNA primase